MEQEEVKQSLINPITHEKVDEAITEAEAKKRGYLELEFMMRYLEDENEFTKYYIVEGKKIIVHMAKPMLQYKKKSAIDYERVLQEIKVEEKTNPSPIPVAPTCNIGDEDCVSCGS